MRPHRGRHALEKVVARLVAEGVVDVLEVVQIDHQHGAGGAVARHPLGLPGQLLVEMAPVGEPGQEVVIDKEPEALRQLLSLGDALNLEEGHTSRAVDPVRPSGAGAGRRPSRLASPV